MRAILTDDTTIHCGGFKAIEHGVVLTEDEDRDDVIGFVPYGELRYIFPEAVVQRRADGRSTPTRVDIEPAAPPTERTVRSSGQAHSSDGGTDDELRRRLDRLERQFEEVLTRLPVAHDESPSTE